MDIAAQVFGILAFVVSVYFLSAENLPADPVSTDALRAAYCQPIFTC